MLFYQQCFMLMQNPEALSLREDIRRTHNKLKLWEKELEERNKNLTDQHSKVAKLEADLEKVTDGISSGSTRNSTRTSYGSRLHMP